MPVAFDTSSVALALAAVLAAGGLYKIGRNAGKPVFVIALCLVAAAIAMVELAEMLGLFVEAGSVYGHVWLGMELSGGWARVAGLVDIAIYVAGAVGLWMLRPWARTGAIVYLLYLLVSFVIWGVRDSSGRGVFAIMAWQMFVLPFITFSLMYLQGGARYFGIRGGDKERKTGWLY
jgi:hypothetical protein